MAPHRGESVLPTLDFRLGRKPVLYEQQPAVRLENPSHLAHGRGDQVIPIIRAEQTRDLLTSALGGRYEIIRLIAQGRFTDAYMVNRNSNVFPGILGRTCDRPCER